MVAEKAPQSPTEQAAGLTTSLGPRFVWNTSAPSFVPEAGKLYVFNDPLRHPGPAQRGTCDSWAAASTGALETVALPLHAWHAPRARRAQQEWEQRLEVLQVAARLAAACSRPPPPQTFSPHRVHWLPGREQEQNQCPQTAARRTAAPADGRPPSRGGAAPHLPPRAGSPGRPRQPWGRGGGVEAAAGHQEERPGRPLRAIPPARDFPPLPPGAWRTQCPGGPVQRGCCGGGEGSDGAAAAPAAAVPLALGASRSACEGQPDSEELFCVTCKNAFIEVAAEPAVVAGTRSQSSPPSRSRCRLDQPPTESQVGAQAGDTIPLGAVTQLARAPDDRKTSDEIQVTAHRTWAVSHKRSSSSAAGKRKGSTSRQRLQRPARAWATSRWPTRQSPWAKRGGGGGAPRKSVPSPP
ncbi:unnamed protein product [Prorocentrum cordatum]|uniref:Uncharacterized protein n=1 Tax=Prorocentrum cordatum TaxID=2364126 RepID=A0ABN9XT28_9DINO|nr:unnamed protein product [Polarella glacialis]